MELAPDSIIRDFKLPFETYQISQLQDWSKKINLNICCTNRIFGKIKLKITSLYTNCEKIFFDNFDQNNEYLGN